MKSSEIKKLPQSQIEFTLMIAWDEWKKNIDGAVKDLSQNIKVDGFRPGKAPREMVEKAVGTGVILETAAEKTIKKTYADFVIKEKLDVVGPPKVEIMKIAEGNDLEYKVVVAVVPVLELGNWKKEIVKINQEKEKKAPIEIQEEEVTKELEKIANSRAKFVTVDREAKNGDSVQIDFKVLMSGVPIENGSGRNHPLVLGTNVFIPGFEENLVGMKENEEKKFELRFPDDYHEKNLAGKDATFEVKVNLVQEREIPVLDDDFVKSLGKFEKIDDLKKNIREGMMEEKKENEKNERRAKYLDKLVESSSVDLPKILVDEETHRMTHEFQNQLSSMGMNFESYLNQIKKTAEELEGEWRPQAEKKLKSAMALKKVAEEMNINVDSEKIEEEMNKTLQYFKKVGHAEKNIDLERLYNYTKEVATNEEVFRYLEGVNK